MIKFLTKYFIRKLSRVDFEEVVLQHPTVKHYAATEFSRGKQVALRQQPLTNPVEVKTVEQVVVYARLTTEVYEYLEKSVNSNTLVSSNTSDIESGFKLGVQHVLSFLRKGYVISKD